MAISTFADKTQAPTEEMVAIALAEVYHLWQELYNYLVDKYSPVVGQWKHYGKASGWVYLMKSDKRTVTYLISLERDFRIRVVLGEKAVAKALASELPVEIKDAINKAIVYVEGRSIDVDISQLKQLSAIKQLIELKMTS